MLRRLTTALAISLAVPCLLVPAARTAAAAPEAKPVSPPAPAPAPATGPLEPDDRRGDGRSPDAEEQRLIAEEERRAAR